MFYADLHVHSKYSRATSRDADLQHMAIWARRKGVTLLGTGDFTHPQWFAELQRDLVPAEPGLFRLRDELERAVDKETPQACAQTVRFVLQVEISTIYKRGERTRKVHHLIYVPGWQQAELLIQKLSKIGNLKSDGRPILGLDSRHLLEIALECGEGCYLVPAHIWTPWFAALGSQSGFDSIDDCYGDLAGEISSLETGLSSDPPMNWRLSQLDRFTLVSNSDAHSPPKIGREACVFDTHVDYFAIRQALRSGEGYGGTVEFFPEEGKYHLDGHRKCNVRLTPDQTKSRAGRCPVCGKPLTIGVMNRVVSLADRADGFRPPRAGAFRNLVPLPEIIAEVRGVGEQSRKVQQAYEELIDRVGAELFVLEQAPLEDIRHAGSPLVAEAIRRMRVGRVIREAGYDGEYGRIRLFEDGELKNAGTVSLLFPIPGDAEAGSVHLAAETSEPWDAKLSAGAGGISQTGADDIFADVAGDLRSVISAGSESRAEREETRAERGDIFADVAGDLRSAISAGSETRAEREETRAERGGSRAEPTVRSVILAQLDPEQRAAAEVVHGPLLSVAGPGTGKTRTLTHRIAHLVADHGVLPEHCLAITFSRRAAEEMRERLAQLLTDSKKGARVPVMTFHALGLAILREHAARFDLPLDFRVADDQERTQLLVESGGLSQRQAGRLLADVSRAKRGGEATAVSDENTSARETYRRLMRERALVDFDDLILLPAELLQREPAIAAEYRRRWPWVSVDEYQDLDDNQYRLLRHLVASDGHLCAIGDPDQSIYGFRGSNPAIFLQFTRDFPTARVVRLTRNYRSSQAIVAAALQAIAPSSLVPDRILQSLSENADRISIHTSPTERAEAEFVVHTIERSIGGSTFFSLDSGRVDTPEVEARSFADFAVLYRTEAQADSLVEAFARSGIPFQKKSHRRWTEAPAVQAMLRCLQEAAPHRSPHAPREDSPAAFSTRPAPASVTDLLQQAAGAVRAEHPQVPDLLAQLHPLAQRCGDDLSRFLTELALGTDADSWDPRADRVSLLTLHAAKGLEFPVVFLVGCEDGLLPLRWGPADNVDVAEERRLFFVGLTRARDRVLLSHARQRLWRGQVRDMPASPFLEQIREELLERIQQAQGRKKRKSTDTQLQLF